MRSGRAKPSPAQAGDFVACALARRDRRLLWRGGDGAFGLVATGAALLPRGLQRAFGEGARRLLGLKLFLELGEPRLELRPLRLYRLGLLGDLSVNRRDLLLRALQRC